MQDPSDLETTIERSFESRSARLDASGGDLDDVLTRVERRRSRRHALAVAGSVSVVVVGVVGIVALGDREEIGPAASPGSGAAAVTIDQTLPGRAAWRCDGQLAYWGEAGDEVYFASCEQTTIDGSVEVLEPPASTSPSEEQPSVKVPGSTEFIAATPSIPVTTVPPGYATDVSPKEQRYKVVAGDSLALIALTFGIDLDTLVSYNEWAEGISHPIFPGDEIRIPPNALIPASPTTEHPTTTTTTTIG